MNKTQWVAARHGNTVRELTAWAFGWASTDTRPTSLQIDEEEGRPSEKDLDRVCTVLARPQEFVQSR